MIVNFYDNFYVAIFGNKKSGVKYVRFIHNFVKIVKLSFTVQVFLAICGKGGYVPKKIGSAILGLNV